MQLVRGLLIALVVGALSIITPPGTASADQLMQGFYSYFQEGVGPTTWKINPLCAVVVGDLREPLYLPVGCKLYVAGSTPSDGVTPKDAYGGNAVLTNNLWTFTVPRPEGLTCPDGSKGPTVETYQFDDLTMTGTKTVSYGPQCGVQANLTKYPFTLAYTGPLEIPVDPYPLDCDPGGLRRCR